MKIRFRSGGLEFSGQRRKSPLAGGTAWVLFHDGVPQDAVEPGQGRLVVADATDLVDALHEGVLQDAFGQRAIVQPTLEAEKRATVGDQLLDIPGFSLKARITYIGEGGPTEMSRTRSGTPFCPSIRATASPGNSASCSLHAERRCT